MKPVPVAWAEMLRGIYGAGMTWKAIARHLECEERNIHKFVNGDGTVSITIERGMWIIRLHQVLCPEAFALVEKNVQDFLRLQTSIEAIQNLSRR